MSDYWGYHLILDIKGCIIDKATDPKHIKKFIKKLLKDIDMVAYGKPKVVHFAEGTEKAGWTVIQLIETSSVVGHFLDRNGDLYLDIFSCKTFDENVVINLINKFFSPENIKTTFLTRQT